MGSRLRVDPAELRVAGVALAAVVATYLSALALERATHRGIGLIVLAVALALTLERTQRDAAPRQRAIALVVLPAVSLAAAGIGWLLLHDPDLGDVVFVAAIGLSIWVRRFGPLATRVGTLVALPCIALLIVPGGAGVGSAPALWAAIVAVLAFVWVSALQLGARRLGWLEPESPPVPRPARAPRTGVVAVSTRMALQMMVALGSAFALGRWLFPHHWSWVVLTAFIVSSGNRGRADVLHKSGQRILGALVGTTAATLIAAAVDPGAAWAVVAIFVVLGAGLWLRLRSYAFWAAAMTGALGLLYGYLGQGGPEVLGQRLLGILLGAALGLAAAWLVLPVRSTDVLRRQVADALAALTDTLRDRGSVHAFHAAVGELEARAAPWRAFRRLRGHGAEAIDAVVAMRRPLDALAAAPPEAFGPDERRALKRVGARVGSVRRMIGGRPDEDSALAWPPLEAGGDGPLGELARIDAELLRLGRLPLGPREPSAAQRGT